MRERVSAHSDGPDLLTVKTLPFPPEIAPLADSAPKAAALRWGTRAQGDPHAFDIF
jgi:hypothetical protein